MHRKEWLATVINARGYRHAVELGVKCGETADHVLSHCPVLETWIGVDLWKAPPGNAAWDHAKHLQEALALLRKHEHRLALIALDTVSASRVLGRESFDLVFIDADHSADAVERDIRAWRSKVRKGGLLCGHDWSKNSVREGVNRAGCPDVRSSPRPNVWWVEV